MTLRNSKVQNLKVAGQIGVEIEDKSFGVRIFLVTSLLLIFPVECFNDEFVPYTIRYVGK